MQTQKIMNKIQLFIKPLIWLALICYGLFLPADKFPDKSFLTIPHADKIIHFGLFFVFCLLLFKPFKHLKVSPYFWAAGISLVFAAVLEIIQQTISSSRTSNIYDFIANTAGIVFSLLIYHFLISGKKWEKYI